MFSSVILDIFDLKRSEDERPEKLDSALTLANGEVIFF